MKRWRLVGIVFLVIFAGVCCLFSSAVSPEDFTGEWYCASDGSLFVFHEGVMESSAHYLELADGERVSGAYCFGKNKIVLFAIDVPGLETEKELYLIKSRDGDVLCEDKHGDGTVYFVREWPVTTASR